LRRRHPKPQNRPVRIRRPLSGDRNGGGGVRRILVATDRSESADRAVRWAAEMAERYEAELLVLQVVAERAAAVLPELEQFAESLGGRGIVEIAEDPSDGIVRAAGQEKVDVLVVGNVGMSGRREFLLGNVPNRVSHNAPCTVVIVNTVGSDRR
jgi:ubiquinone biosynthesis protein